MTILSVTTNLDTGDDATIGANLAADIADGGGLSIREALNYALSGDTITFDAGLSGQTIRLTNSLETGDKTLTFDGDLNDDGVADIIISGDESDNDVKQGDNTGTTFDESVLTQAIGNTSAGDNVRLFDATSAAGDKTLTFDGLVLTGGVAQFATNGGVILSTSADFVFTNSIISGNEAVGAGGALQTGGDITITGSTIANNEAHNSGGAIRGASTSQVIITDSTVSGNQSTGSQGGAVANLSGRVTVTDSTVSDNTASAAGGGIISNATVVISGSTFDGNKANSSHGGAIRAGDVTIDESTFSNNEGVFGGAIQTTRTLTADNSTFYGNKGSNSGGSIYSVTAATFTNSTFFDNESSQSGGAVYAATLTITSSTLTGNEANDGGAVFYATTGSITDSLLLGNVGTTSDQEVATSSGTLTFFGNNIVGKDNAAFDASVSVHVSNANPVDVFASVTGDAGVLADNGGSVQTVALKADTSNPAIDAAAGGSIPATDARGTARTDFDGADNNSGGSLADLGAFEALNPAPPTSSGAGSSSPTPAIPSIVTGTPDADSFEIEDTDAPQTFLGGDGDDTLTFGTKLEDFTIKPSENGYAFTNEAGQVIEVQNVETLVFNDKTLTLNTDPAAKQLVLLYQVMMDRAEDIEGVSFWNSQMESDIPTADIIAFFLASEEFTGKLPENPSFEDYLTLLYQNSFEREADQQGMAFWKEQLESGQATLTDVAFGFSESSEMQDMLGRNFDNGVFLFA